MQYITKDNLKSKTLNKNAKVALNEEHLFIFIHFMDSSSLYIPSKKNIKQKKTKLQKLIKYSEEKRTEDIKLFLLLRLR